MLKMVLFTALGTIMLFGMGCSIKQNIKEDPQIKIERCKTWSELTWVDTQAYVDKYNEMNKQYYSEHGVPYPGGGETINAEIEHDRKKLYLECLSK